jgi:hypothetical protein
MVTRHPTQRSCSVGACTFYYSCTNQSLWFTLWETFETVSAFVTVVCLEIDEPKKPQMVRCRHRCVDAYKSLLDSVWETTISKLDESYRPPIYETRHHREVYCLQVISCACCTDLFVGSKAFHCQIKHHLWISIPQNKRRITSSRHTTWFGSLSDLKSVTP